MTNSFEICEISDDTLALKNLSDGTTHEFKSDSIGHTILWTVLSENHQWSSSNVINTKVAEFLIKHLDETQ